MDVNYITIFLSPMIFFVFFMIFIKICWKWCCCIRQEMNEEESSNIPIYIIPISINDPENHRADVDSVVSVDPYSPPSYDSLDPPPPYFEKLHVPEEAPPAYSELALPAGSARSSSSPELQRTFYNEP